MYIMRAVIRLDIYMFNPLTSFLNSFPKFKVLIFIFLLDYNSHSVQLWTKYANSHGKSFLSVYTS